MSVTSFRSDPARIRKELEISTYSGQYFLNTPGQGSHMPFLEEPQLRLQSWGANYDAQHILDIQEQLRGTAQKLTKSGMHHTHNDTNYQHYRSFASQTAQQYPMQEPFVKESRVSHPAWMLRDLDRKYSRWEQPWLDPQGHTELSFEADMNSKREAKASYQQPTPNGNSSVGGDSNNSSIGYDFVQAWLPPMHNTMR